LKNKYSKFVQLTGVVGVDLGVWVSGNTLILVQLAEA